MMAAAALGAAKLRLSRQAFPQETLRACAKGAE